MAKPMQYGLHAKLVGYVTSREKPLRAGYALYRTHFGLCDEILGNNPPPAHPELQSGLF
jgi:hypothetical protein